MRWGFWSILINCEDLAYFGQFNQETVLFQSKYNFYFLLNGLLLVCRKWPVVINLGVLRIDLTLNPLLERYFKMQQWVFGLVLKPSLADGLCHHGQGEAPPALTYLGSYPLRSSQFCPVMRSRTKDLENSVTEVRPSLPPFPFSSHPRPGPAVWTLRPAKNEIMDPLLKIIKQSMKSSPSPSECGAPHTLPGCGTSSWRGPNPNFYFKTMKCASFISHFLSGTF